MDKYGRNIAANDFLEVAVQCIWSLEVR